MSDRVKTWIGCSVVALCWALGVAWTAFCVWLLVLAARCGLKYLGS